MSAPLALLAVLLQTRETQEILTQNGSQLTRVSVEPTSLSPRSWQYRLYQPNTPALGPRYWGVVEEPYYEKLKGTLNRQRLQQTAWWSWLGRSGRPEPMPFTMFNALGPIAVMDDEGWSQVWGQLGPGAAREIAARRRRLEAAREVEDALYNMISDANWSPTFETNLFRYEGVAVYQAGPIVNALLTLRGLETDLRSAGPISLYSANKDLMVLAMIGERLTDAAAQVRNIKPPAAGALAPAISTADAVNLLNNKFGEYRVKAGENGSESETGTMSFAFTPEGFSLVKAPKGWYGGVEPVAFASLDPTTVRFDPQFGGPQRGGIVFLPKDSIRNSYRGPNALLLPLGTTPREAETLAQAFRRLVRAGNGMPEAVRSDTTPPDQQTIALVERLKSLGEKLSRFGGMKFGDRELLANAPAGLTAAIARRDNLWRDSEIGTVLSKQILGTAAYSVNGASVPLSGITPYLGVPMSLTPIEPPSWRIVRVNHRPGGENRVIVREASRAQAGKNGPLYTIFRLSEETWTDTAVPHLKGIRMIASGQTPVPDRVSIEQLSKGFFAKGDAFLQQNRLPQAERMLRRAVALQPGWASAWNWLGVAIVRQGRVDDAAPISAQSVRLNPKYALALTNLADIRRVQGQLAESKDLARRATLLTPKDPWAHTVLGHACFAAGEFNNAEKHYRDALALDPSNGATHADLAGALLREGKKQEATSEASRAMDLGWNTHWVYKELAMPEKGEPAPAEAPKSETKPTTAPPENTDPPKTGS